MRSPVDERLVIKVSYSLKLRKMLFQIFQDMIGGCIRVKLLDGNIPPLSIFEDNNNRWSISSHFNLSLQTISATLKGFYTKNYRVCQVEVGVRGEM